MQDACHAEALALLSQPSICEDAPDWRPGKDKPWHMGIECGLIRADGIRAGLLLTLEYVFSPKTRITRYQFGIYRALLGGRQRVYQLSISHARKPVKDLHALPHEHYGNQRLPCPPQASAWTFAEALSYFAQRTNLTFRPPVEDPSTFRLKP